MKRLRMFVPAYCICSAMMGISVCGAMENAPAHKDNVGDVLMSYDASCVVVGNEAPALLTSMKEILDLTDSQDVVVHIRALIELLERGNVMASQEIMTCALDEAFDVLERHHERMSDERLENLIENLMMVWDRVYSEDWDESDEDNQTRGCSKKSKSFCSITVQGRANVGDLNVSGDETVAGNTILNGTLTVGGTTLLKGDVTVGTTTIPANLTVTGNAVIDGTLTVNGVPFGNFYAQGGNSFGTTAVLGTLDNNDLTFITNRTLDANNPRVIISNTGAVTIRQPTTGIALTVNGNTGATAQLIQAGANQVALAITGGANATAAESISAGTNSVGLAITGNGIATAETITAGVNGKGLTVQGNGTANAVEISAGTGTGGALKVTGGSGATAQTITAGAGQTALAITGNSTTNAPAETITSGFAAQPALQIIGNPAASQTVAGLTVNNAATVNTGGAFGGVFVGGTQVTTTLSLPTVNAGTPRMIWAKFNGSLANNNALISQSGGITAVVHAVGLGVYTITYDTFVQSPIIVVTPDTTAGPGFSAVATAGIASATVITSNTAGVPADASFSLLIMGLAS